MKCQQCGTAMEPDEVREYGDKSICEDCYIDALTPAKACDPWATYTASRLDTQELNPAQESILACIDQTGEASLEKILSETGLDQEDFQREFAALHHMELAGAAQRPGNKKVFVRMVNA
ncbi:MAG: hypothetical protein K9K66_07385 [Desulfarculaceae bacterium]|nr:hypothetical protein [Desulfarculaceae bacterium]MCF8071948.1 hypothetical protein [Desulfarculaceae bacterium]MCF8101465.1 hypothetical protein [Desulfarculaceae bacterium]MCF8115015.1 hypothetical protein [Desulfarculaceae bacterium]